MRPIRIFGNSIYKRVLTAISVLGCCSYAWEDSIVWDDDCPWLEECCGEIWNNNETWENDCLYDAPEPSTPLTSEVFWEEGSLWDDSEAWLYSDVWDEGETWDENENWI